MAKVIQLKVEDINKDRMMLKVTNGKGRKDRYTLLSEKALELLRQYYQVYKPKIWLFEGAKENYHISERTVQHIFDNARKNANIQQYIH